MYRRILWTLNFKDLLFYLTLSVCLESSGSRSTVLEFKYALDNLCLQRVRQQEYGAGPRKGCALFFVYFLFTSPANYYA